MKVTLTCKILPRPVLYWGGKKNKKNFFYQVHAEFSPAGSGGAACLLLSSVMKRNYAVRLFTIKYPSNSCTELRPTFISLSAIACRSDTLFSCLRCTFARISHIFFCSCTHKTRSSQRCTAAFFFNGPPWKFTICTSQVPRLPPAAPAPPLWRAAVGRLPPSPSADCCSSPRLCLSTKRPSETLRQAERCTRTQCAPAKTKNSIHFALVLLPPA